MTQPLRQRAATFVVSALVAASALVISVAPVAATGSSSFVGAVNAYRDDAGLGPVSLNALVDKIAVERAQQMANAEEMAHDMDYVGQRLGQLGVCWNLFGEIIAYSGSDDPSHFVDMWFNSDGHRAIMLNPRYGIVGGSYARGADGTYYAAMVFVDPCGDAPAPTSSGTFSDIGGSLFKADIAWLVNEDITAGCGGTRFCPRSTVTREQMASFMQRATGVSAASHDFFMDDNRSEHEGDINRVAQAGITGGCADARYCPGSGVTRGQMASFLVRALNLPAASRDYFRDDNDSIHESSINRLAQAGITGGCDTGRFCPNAYITREQMAGFLHRAFGA